MQIYLAHRFPVNCQFYGYADSSKDTKKEMQKKSQGMVCSPQKCHQAVGRWQEGRLVRRHLSIILGLRES